MNSKYLGDSYDLVKGSFITSLQPLGQWWVHPMFTEHFTKKQLDDYEKLLHAPLITPGLVPSGPHRKAFIELSHRPGNVLFDPDTGLRMEGQGLVASAYLRGEELLNCARARPDALTAVFDQSLSRGQERDELQAKVNALHASEFAAFAYYSHACFIFVSANRERLDFARSLLVQAGVPQWRLLCAAA
ncbi:MAG TPA: hypothetical protein VGO11_27025 [Chthoniobacteraceae bacterium]|jgi:hypothetical protein|nr:hypothetical protein [Chthoniobacteraceae bacterium]